MVREGLVLTFPSKLRMRGGNQNRTLREAGECTMAERVRSMRLCPGIPQRAAVVTDAFTPTNPGGITYLTRKFGNLENDSGLHEPNPTVADR
mmetsp:Transcript_43649/g.170833  ORF Transcript_43649/g.170833 Transcript_43649/m.170833 type:complete len:92 (+) Transcript_43649:3648-3923(+)